LNPTPVQADDKAPTDHMSLRLNGYAPNGRAGQGRRGSDRTRRHITGPQRVAAALIAGVCVFGAVWYVPRIAAADGSSLAGTVTNSGVVYLNFSSSGQLATITATIGQRVSKGQLLATEVAPATAAVLAAARAAITADKSELAAALSGGTASAIDAARAQLARDKGQLAIDRAEAAGTRIVAPAAGTVIAVNGQPGETADGDGIRDYSAPGTSASQRPLFSLLPEGPQSGGRAAHVWHLAGQRPGSGKLDRGHKNRPARQRRRARRRPHRHLRPGPGTADHTGSDVAGHRLPSRGDRPRPRAGLSAERSGGQRPAQLVRPTASAFSTPAAPTTPARGISHTCIFCKAALTIVAIAEKWCLGIAKQNRH
jgi:uncharacterized RDD family membrane protein YckC